jgi:hypothetical protein
MASVVLQSRRGANSSGMALERRHWTPIGFGGSFLTIPPSTDLPAAAQ